MPCRPRMLGCRRDCAHRALVEAYRDARNAAELDREAVTAGYATESEAYGPLPTFRDWLVSTRGAGRDTHRSE